MNDTFYDVLRRQGISRRSFLKFCSLTTSGTLFYPPSWSRARRAAQL